MYNYNKEIVNDHIFNFIYGCALHDAVLQKAFEGERRWIGKVFDAKQTVKEYINRIISGELIDEKKHKDNFLETSKEVCYAINSYKDKPDSAGIFNFGNAQKLINMTVKHVYAHIYSIHLASNDSISIREHFRYCHCPMDSIMLKNVWKEFDKGSRKTYLGSNFCNAWGCEEFKTDEQGNEILPDRYERFQDAIKKIINRENGDIFPIEYDYISWKNDDKD